MALTMADQDQGGPVIGVVNVEAVTDRAEIERCDSPAGKPFLRIRLLDGGPVVNISANLAEMLGAIGRAIRQEWENEGRAEAARDRPTA